MFNKGPTRRSKFNAYFVVGLFIAVCLPGYSYGSKSFKRKLEKIYTNGWAVKVKGGFGNAKSVAERHGFAKVEKVCVTFI